MGLFEELDAPDRAGQEICRAELRALHATIDLEVARLAARHRARMRCTIGCNACCADDLTVTSIEADRIRSAHPDLLARGRPHAPGACAFLDEKGACRIYADRPSVCRSQGLPLRALVENELDEIEERRDICPVNLAGGPPVDVLREDDCWLVGPAELKLRSLDDRFVAAAGGGRGSRDDADERVPLRSLFARD